MSRYWVCSVRNGRAAHSRRRRKSGAHYWLIDKDYEYRGGETATRPLLSRAILLRVSADDVDEALHVNEVFGAERAGRRKGGFSEIYQGRVNALTDFRPVS